MVTSTKNKTRDLTSLLIGLVIIVLINVVASFVFHRFDLTSEKRYSLSEASKQIVKELEEPVFVRVYLEGNDLPAGFDRLKNSIKETLDELRVYGNLEYEFINPSESTDQKTRNEVYQRLVDQGLQYTNLEVRTGDKVSEQIVFPGAIITYLDKEIPVQLLKSQMGADSEVMLNNSIQQLEYEIVSSIKKLTRDKKQKIGFLQGHGELLPIQTGDFAKTLEEFYTVDWVDIKGQLKALAEFDALIVAKPDSAFSEKDKFIIDQFVMRGGKILWMIDGVHASMDSLRVNATSMGVGKELNLDDMLFKYGARVNPNLVMDLQSLPIPIVTGMIGNQPKQELFPWFYFPLIMSNEALHPIVKNLDAIKTQFVNTIDTVGGKGIKKSVLLTSSDLTKLVNAPTRISLNVLRDPPDQRQYSKGKQPIAVLLEGRFKSVFKNRIPPQIENDKSIGFKDSSIVNTSMIVVADGDIIRNRVNYEENRFYPLGFDTYTNRTYANKDFLLNAVNYLCDDSGLIEARGKDIKLRLLNKTKAENESLKWQLINTVVPVLVIILFGVIKLFVRKRRYT